MSSLNNLKKRLKEDAGWPADNTKWLPCICGADIDKTTLTEDYKFTGLLPMCKNGHFQYKFVQQPIHPKRLKAEANRY